MNSLIIHKAIVERYVHIHITNELFCGNFHKAILKFKLYKVKMFL